jgi:hypothetical protein
MSRPIISISQPWGGLGDNLAFSTLPQLYTEQGHDVYISSQNHVRNQEIYDLVWGLNPYIKGITKQMPNAGSCKGINTDTDNCIKNMEIIHGLTEGKNEYPIIYYKPKYITDLSNCLLYDTTSISGKYDNGNIIIEEFTKIFDKYPMLTKKKVIFKHLKNRDEPNLNTDTIEVNNIYEYCDFIYSSNVFLSLLSGQSALASAIKQKNSSPIIYTVLPNSNKLSNNLMYIFNNINFINCRFPPQ